MIHRTLQGLLFAVPSPSHYELVLPDHKLDRLCIAYLGDDAPPSWWLFHRDAAGNVLTREFPSRDAAMAMVAQAFQHAGAL